MWPQKNLGRRAATRPGSRKSRTALENRGHRRGNPAFPGGSAPIDVALEPPAAPTAPVVPMRRVPASQQQPRPEGPRGLRRGKRRRGEPHRHGQCNRLSPRPPSHKAAIRPTPREEGEHRMVRWCLRATGDLRIRRRSSKAADRRPRNPCRLRTQAAPNNKRSGDAAPLGRGPAALAHPRPDHAGADAPRAGHPTIGANPPPSTVAALPAPAALAAPPAAVAAAAPTLLAQACFGKFASGPPPPHPLFPPPPEAAVAVPSTAAPAALASPAPAAAATAPTSSPRVRPRSVHVLRPRRRHRLAADLTGTPAANDGQLGGRGSQTVGPWQEVAHAGSVDAAAAAASAPDAPAQLMCAAGRVAEAAGAARPRRVVAAPAVGVD
mmetsp:Transcript_10407/g.29686  ORF Transcript_10407/g.29686 Transcript_10407/m.29686 type:complete len:380 (-) Transcript_10407:119-1258(-)